MLRNFSSQNIQRTISQTLSQGIGSISKQRRRGLEQEPFRIKEQRRIIRNNPEIFGNIYFNGVEFECRDDVNRFDAFETDSGLRFTREFIKELKENHLNTGRSKSKAKFHHDINVIELAEEAMRSAIKDRIVEIVKVGYSKRVKNIEDSLKDEGIKPSIKALISEAINEGLKTKTSRMKNVSYLGMLNKNKICLVYDFENRVISKDLKRSTLLIVIKISYNFKDNSAQMDVISMEPCNDDVLNAFKYLNENSSLRSLHKIAFGREKFHPIRSVCKPINVSKEDIVKIAKDYGVHMRNILV